MNVNARTWFKGLPWVSSALGSPTSIGLHLGADRLNLVQMNGAGRAHLRAMASLPCTAGWGDLISSPATLRALVKKAFAAEPFSGRTVVSCLPSDQIKILSISYVHAEGQTDDDAIVAELRDRLKDELDEMVVDYLLLRRDEGDVAKRDALVALAPRARVLSYLHLLSDAGLKVDALDIGPAALARVVKHTCARRYPDYPALPNALLINFGADCSYLTVVWGRRIVLDRVIDFSERGIFERLHTALDMSHELATRMLCGPGDCAHAQDEGRRIVEEVIRPDLLLLHQEINKTLVYMASRTRGKSVDCVFLAGPVARYGSVVASLQAQLRIPVHILNPVLDFAGVPQGGYDESLGTTAGMALAAGLCLRGVPEYE